MGSWFSFAIAPKPVDLIFPTCPTDFTEAQGWQVRSASKEFIAKLTAIRCELDGCNRTFEGPRYSIVQGEKKLLDANLPMMAYCGHYICASHKTSYTMGNPFECPNGEPPPKPPQFNLFVHDEVLNDLYKAISEAGFKCFDCEELHPKYNIILCSKYAEDNGKRTKYLCVWCFNKDQYADMEFESMRGRSDLQGDIEDGKKLVSLDRTQDKAGWALNRCCICRNSLYNPEKEDRTMIVHLSNCDHFAHKKCVDSWLGFKCRICKDGTSRWCYWWNMSTVTKEISAQTKHYFEGINSNEIRDFFFCGVKQCYQTHPKTNSTRGNSEICVWCNVEVAHEQNKENRRNAIRNIP